MGVTKVPGEYQGSLAKEIHFQLTQARPFLRPVSWVNLPKVTSGSNQLVRSQPRLRAVASLPAVTMKRHPPSFH